MNLRCCFVYRRFLGFLIVSFGLCLPALAEVSPMPPQIDAGTARYTLAEMLELASARNPSLAAYLANIESVRGETVTARAYPNPTMTFQGGRGEPRGADVGIVSPGTEYQGTVLQPLEWPLKRQSRIQAAGARLEVARLDAEGFRLFLRAATKDAFYRVLLTAKQAELAERNVNTVKELRRSVDVRVRTGEGAAFELVKADVELLKAEKEVNRARNQVNLARASLNALFGNTLPASFSLLGEFERPQALIDLPILIEQALAKHPVIDRQRREVERWRHQLNFERQARVPDVGVGGMMMREIDKDALGVVLSVPFPIWDRRAGWIATALAEGQRAEAELARVRTELTRSITQEYQNYRIAQDQLAVFERGLLKQSEEALRIAQTSFRQGASGLLDLLDAQRVQRATLQEYYAALFDLSAAYAQLEQVTGRVDLLP
jgi:cobalt-zinc-cadmium efflux system outer membrane protein